MQWLSSKVRLTPIVFSVLVVACVTTTTRIFLSSAQNPIYRPEQAEPVLKEYLRLQCPAFQKAHRPDSGTVRLLVAVNARGFATRAELTRSSGDQLVDEVFGTIGAQLVFRVDSLNPKPRQERVAMQFRCWGDSTSVSVK